MSKGFYITTAIAYPNGPPHMGHAYEQIVADCYARWHRFLGDETYFLTGTDENGQKLQKAAHALGMDTKDFVDGNVEIFKKLCRDMDIFFDDFIRTTEERHKRVCRKLWLQLEKRGDLYFGKYSGQYCFSCENFYPSLQAPDGKCPHHGSKLTLKEEEGLFFKLGQYQEWILNHFKTHPHFVIPKKSYHEILSRLEKETLKDVAFSRPNEGWGIPVPGHEKKLVMYTWADALMNYYSAIQAGGLEEKFWPADVHVIGKDIIWFHSVIWPCILHALDLPLPRQIYVHGMILAEDGRKMSKSLGNVVDPALMLQKYSLDTFRYYLLRGIPSQSDGLFSERELVERHNNELGNDYGNLIMRVIKLSLKNLPPDISGKGVEQHLDFGPILEKMKECMEKREHHKAMDILWEGVNEVNQYVNEKAPWKFKKDPSALSPIIYNCCFAIHQLAFLMGPFMPVSATQTRAFLNPSTEGWEALKFGETSYQLQSPTALYPRIE